MKEWEWGYAERTPFSTQPLNSANYKISILRKRLTKRIDKHVNFKQILENCKIFLKNAIKMIERYFRNTFERKFRP